jgi:putative ABC transport system substrate-binding protein
MLSAMRRRGFLVGLAACASLAWAQSPAPRWRIGYLGPSADTAPRLLAAFKEGLAANGYQEGRNVVVEYRWTNAGTAMNDASTLLASAVDLVARKVDVVVASIDPAILAASKATRSVPIVMLNASDPVGSGFVESLSRPGGNITGMTNTSSELTAKKLQTLCEAIPHAKRIGMLVSGPRATRETTVASARAAAAVLGVTLDIVDLDDIDAIASSVKTLKARGAEALFIADTGGGIFFTSRRRLAETAIANGLPLMAGNAENAEAGALLALAPDAVENYRRAALFVDRILKGARPADLPVELPAAYQLTINKRTAKLLNVTVPKSLLLRDVRTVE